MGQTLSVSQALALVKDSLEQISATIVGEISEISDKPGYKAIYFTIRDKSSALSCLIWRNIFQNAELVLKQGILVEVSGIFSLYAAKGRMNFDVKTIRLAGEGDLRLKVALLAKKLETEGLMDPKRKRPVPAYPSAIAVVTSPRGKAIHDVLRTLRRRFPLAEVLVVGVPVEGAQAARSIQDGLLAAQASNAELILLVRGGGSYEDLMPFNDEQLARAIAASVIPVVTGIGHEPDNSIADMVADFRASTPTAAAEHVVPDITDLKNSLDYIDDALARLLRMQLERACSSFERLRNRPLFFDKNQLTASHEISIEGAALRLHQILPNKLAYDRQLAAGIQARMSQIAKNLINPFRRHHELQAAQLSTLSPLAVLTRGYSIAYDADGHVIDSVDRVDLGQDIIIRLVDGTMGCQITDKTHKYLTGNDTEGHYV